MGKRNAISALGYGIIAVIMVAMGIIISTPMMANKYKDKQHEPAIELSSTELLEKMQNMESRINSRIDSLEQPDSNRYVCKIEGYIDEFGNTVSIEENQNYDKFVFVCEYKN